MAALTTIVIYGPMLALLEDVPMDRTVLADEQHINAMSLWEMLLYYWPSIHVPPYTITDGYIWVWSREGNVETWEIVGLQ